MKSEIVKALRSFRSWQANRRSEAPIRRYKRGERWKRDFNIQFKGKDSNWAPRVYWSSMCQFKGKSKDCCGCPLKSLPSCVISQCLGKWAILGKHFRNKKKRILCPHIELWWIHTWNNATGLRRYKRARRVYRQAAKVIKGWRLPYKRALSLKR